MLSCAGMPDATLQTMGFNRANIHFYVRGKWASAQPLKQLAKCAAFPAV